MNRFVLSIFSLVLAPAAGATTIYQSQAVFDAAGAGTVETENFDAIGGLAPAPFTYGAFAFSGNVIAVPATVPPAYEAGSPNETAWIQYQLGEATVSFASAVRSFGFDVRSYHDDVGDTVSFLTDTGEAGSFLLGPNDSAGFLGFGFSQATTSVTFSVLDGGSDPFGEAWFGTDNYRSYSSAAATVSEAPEAATWAMFIAGFGLIGAAMRRRRRVNISFA